MENQPTITTTLAENISISISSSEKKQKILKSANKKDYFHSWYLENREKVIKRVSQYNKEKSEYVVCECGKPIQLKNTRHIHTDLHKRWLEKKQRLSQSTSQSV